VAVAVFDGALKSRFQHLVNDRGSVFILLWLRIVVLHIYLFFSRDAQEPLELGWRHLIRRLPIYFIWELL